jgi:uncharacterized protein (UPF0332 family)
VDDATKRLYIAAHLARATDDLATARDNVAHGHWRGAVNRAYYAIFHAASAALLQAALWHNSVCIAYAFSVLACFIMLWQCPTVS